MILVHDLDYECIDHRAKFHDNPSLSWYLNLKIKIARDPKTKKLVNRVWRDLVLLRDLTNCNDLQTQSYITFRLDKNAIDDS